MKKGQRVRIAGDGPGAYVSGTVWRPSDLIQTAYGTTNHHLIATKLGLCVDPPERGDIMVGWDSRPGVLQAHHLDELELVEEEDDGVDS